MRVLLDHGIPIAAVNSDGKTALHLACEQGHRDCVKKFIASFEKTEFSIEAHTADVQKSFMGMKDSRGYTPLHSAALMGCCDILKILINEV